MTTHQIRTPQPVVIMAACKKHNQALQGRPQIDKDGFVSLDECYCTKDVDYFTDPAPQDSCTHYFELLVHVNPSYTVKALTQ